MRALIVEADESIRGLVKYLLVGHGVSEVLEHSEAEAGMHALKQLLQRGGELPGLIVTEIQPSSNNRDGLDLCHWVKGHEKLSSIPLVALVQEDDLETQRLAFSVGGYDVIPKIGDGNQLAVRLPAAVHFAMESAQRRETLQRLERELSFNTAVVNSLSNMGEGLFTIELRRVTFANTALCKLTGFSEEELKASPDFLKLFHPDEHDRILENHRRRIAGETFESRYETALQAKDGSRIEVDFSVSVLVTPTYNGVVCLVRDIRQEVAQRSYMQNLAHFDQLTGLPNRRLMYERLDHALRRAQRAATEVGLLFIDLDGFKGVNDTLGHGAGDELLVLVAGRLVNTVRAADTAARLAGDEFVVILESDIPGEVDPIRVAKKLLTEIRRPYPLAAGEVYISASIGVVKADGSENIETIMHEADSAMYHAKQSGKNGYFMLGRTSADEVGNVDYHL